MLRWIAVVLISVGLSGCGQKGDLYYPPLSEQLPAAQPPAEQPNAAPATPAHP